MAIPRSQLIDQSQPGVHHLVSRCVRRAHLCGGRRKHRRDWLAAAVDQVSRQFALEILSFSVMDNHFHMVVATDPARALGWSDLEVATRWAALHPHSKGLDPEPEPWTAEEIAALAADPLKVLRYRKQLASISYCQKWIKEPVARRANREDQVTGHFWEGRFHSKPLLDQGAIIAAMAYVDLNPVRAGLADRPETSLYTSVRERIRRRQDWRRAQLLEQQDPRLLSPELRRTLELGPESELSLAPLAHCVPPAPEGQPPLPGISLDEYLELVDATGRIIRSDKRGSIPQHLQPILERLEIDAEHWVDVMRSQHGLLGAAIGCAWARATEAARRGVKWIKRTFSLYRDDPSPDLPPAPG